MSASPAKLCDPSRELGEAIRQASECLKQEPGFEINLSRYLQLQLLSSPSRSICIFRGLEVLAGITEDERLLTMLRPFLRSTDPQIASKTVLLLGRSSLNMGWMATVMAEVDDRVRANLVESLWGRREPELEELLQNASTDPHHRVAANAIYGLYLLGSDSYLPALRVLTTSHDPLRRRSAVWVVQSAAEPDAASLLKPLITDHDDGVRHAAFKALISLRQKASTSPSPQQAAASA